MPRAIGSDRLEPAPGGRLYLFARYAKGWRPRVEKGRLTPEHPGTAVRWEEEIYEVLDVYALEGGGLRYALAPWDERHAIRVAESYDEASEARRQLEHEAHERRERHRGALLVLMPFLGCLPASVQEAIEREYAIPATRLTLASVVPLLLYGVVSVISMWLFVIAGLMLLPFRLMLAGNYFWVESLVRLSTSMAQGRPIGSLLGTLPWELIQILGGKRRLASRGPEPDAPSREQAARDSFHLLEPFLSFLDVGDQARLKDAFGFDGIRWGKVTAVLILVAVGPMFLSLLLGTLFRSEHSNILLVAVAGTLAVEQIFRIMKLGRGQPAPSILRFLVRPLARRILGPSRP